MQVLQLLGHEPERRGHGQRDDSRLTGHTLSRTNLPVGDLDALDAARRAIAERRHHAQRKLDYAVPVHRRYQGEDRVLDATRPRYLAVQPGDAHAHATPAVEQPAHPALWLPLYREAAHHDVDARRRDQRLDQPHPDGPPLDVTLDRAVLEPDPRDRDDDRDDWGGDGAGTGRAGVAELGVGDTVSRVPALAVGVVCHSRAQGGDRRRSRTASGGS